MIYIGIIIVTVLIDLGSKMWAASLGLFHDIPVIEGFFHITYVQNTVMAWSLLSGQQGVLALVAAVAIGLMGWYLFVKKPDILTGISLALMIGGAAGNLIDRLFLNYVRDFLNFYIFGYDFPVFNVADMALCIGVFLLLIATWKEEKNGKTNVDRK